MGGGLTTKPKRLTDWLDPMDFSGTRKMHEAKDAAAAQQAELQKQTALLSKQDALVAEEQAKADAEATERAARMAKGRTGLLYGAETGVTSPEVLGG